MRGGRRGRVSHRRATGSLVIVSLLGASHVAGATSAEAAAKVYEEVRHEVADGSAIPTGDAACPRIPGLTRGAKIWAAFYVDSGLTRWSSLRFELWTRYQPPVAVAKVAYQQVLGREPTCQELYGAEAYGQMRALESVACSPTAGASRPNRWCQLMTIDGLARQSFDLELDRCREPAWNGGAWGPIGYAGWHDLDLFLDKFDIIDEIGNRVGQLDWLPGHIKGKAYLDDLEFISGVSNLDPNSLQPYDGADRFIGYGKVQNAAVSERLATTFDQWATKLGHNPYGSATATRNAYAAVAGAIAANANIPGVGAAGSAYRNLVQTSCNETTWVRDVLDPSVDFGCVGFPFRFFNSFRGNGLTMLEFIDKNTDDELPEQLVEAPFFLPGLIQEAYSNTGRVIVRDPRDPECTPVLDIGTGRDTHIRKLFGDLGAALGEGGSSIAKLPRIAVADAGSTVQITPTYDGRFTSIDLDVTSYAGWLWVTERRGGVPVLLPGWGRIGSGNTMLRPLTGITQISILTGDRSDTISYNTPGIAVSVNAAGGDDIIRPVNGAPSGTLNGGAGSNTLDYSARPGPVTVRLPAPGTWSEGNGLNGVDRHTISNFDHVVGSPAGNTLHGNDNRNWLIGGAGNDWFDGGGGADIFNAGAGVDTLSYARRLTPVTLTLPDADAATEAGEGDLVGPDIENVVGGSASDTIVGNSADNLLQGGPGGDVLDGGGGVNTVSYTDRFNRLSVTLPEPGATSAGTGDGDSLRNFDRLLGGPSGGEWRGNSRANVLWGGAGDDVLDGGGGADVVIGGAGRDTLSYARHTADVTATLADTGVSTNNGAAGEGDIVVADVEDLTGGAGNDTLVGNTQANRVDGGPGNDAIDGGAGDDTILGGAGGDRLRGGPGTNTVSYADHTQPVDVALPEPGAFTTVYEGTGASDELREFTHVIGGSGDDVLIGNSQTNVLTGGPGNDRLYSGGGSVGDFAGYADHQAPVTVAFVTNANGSGGSAGEADVIHPSIQNAIGGSAGDVLTGHAGANELRGGPGDDTLIGNGGGDVLRGDANNDKLFGDAGPSAPVAENGVLRLAEGSHGPDVFDGGAGDDFMDAADGTTDTVTCGDGWNDEVFYDYSEYVADSFATVAGGPVTGDCERGQRVGWGRWKDGPLAGIPVGSVSVTSARNGTIDLFFRYPWFSGVGQNIGHRRWNGAGWETLADIGPPPQLGWVNSGTVTAQYTKDPQTLPPPAAATLSDGRVILASAGPAGNAAGDLYHVGASNPAYSVWVTDVSCASSWPAAWCWQNIGAPPGVDWPGFMGQVAISRLGNQGGYTVFVNNFSQVWARAYTAAGGWSAWIWLDGVGANVVHDTTIAATHTAWGNDSIAAAQVFVTDAHQTRVGELSCTLRSAPTSCVFARDWRAIGSPPSGSLQPAYGFGGLAAATSTANPGKPCWTAVFMTNGEHIYERPNGDCQRTFSAPWSKVAPMRGGPDPWPNAWIPAATSKADGTLTVFALRGVGGDVSIKQIDFDPRPPGP